jgi:hypothetical protein
MLSRCSGMGDNPYCVNVITFSGHGLTFDGDAIAVIPELESKDSDSPKSRFINVSGLARKFSGRNHTINIFIMSMCRDLLK